MLDAGLLLAQARPTASRAVSVWIGGEVSTFSPDYGSNRLSGLGVYADLDLIHHWGAEAEARWLHFGGAGNQEAANYLIGGRYRIALAQKHIQPYAKLLIGDGNMSFPDNIGHGSYFSIVPGGGVDIQLSPRLRVRGEYEYQFWPSAPGFPGFRNNGLNPSGFSFGASWRLP